MKATPTVPPMADSTAASDNVTMRRRATDWKPPASLTQHDDGSVTVSRSRLNACLEAAYELDAIAGLLPSSVPRRDEVSMQAHLVVRGLSDRIKRLSSVLLSGLDDEAEQLHELELCVFGAAQKEAA